MKVRFKKTGRVCNEFGFTVCGIGEISIGDDSVYISQLDVFVNGEWKDMSQAFKDRDIIPNDHNTRFNVPPDEESRERGWYW